MTSFGRQLRTYRTRCRDPLSGKPLSQERLGILLGEALGDQGYTGQAISAWERDKAKPNRDERKVLVGLLAVMRQYGGLQTTEDAEALLRAGTYRSLDGDEQARVFGPPTVVPAPPDPLSTPPKPDVPRVLLAAAERQFRRWRAFRRRAAQVSQGMSPAWPRLVVWLLRAQTDRVQPTGVLRGLYWLGVWALSAYLTAPFFAWPFPNRQALQAAVVQYVAASLVIPLLIALGINQPHQPAWRARPDAGAVRVWLFSLQGACMGYGIGFMGLYWLNLCAASLGLETEPVLIALSAALPVGLGVWSTHLMADNLWRAYGRLSLRANAVVFVFVGFGALWGAYFIQLYEWLPDPRHQLALWGIGLGGVALWARFASRPRSNLLRRNRDAVG